MKKILTLFLLLIALSIKSQNVLHAGVDWRIDDSIQSSELKSMSPLTAACGSPFLSTGYPVWTNYWAGWMVKIINTNPCPIVINSFEARFQGTSGYRIYTKTGTFIGFETTAAAWTLVGTVASLTGTSTTAPTAIPIAVNITIPVGGSQSFYLTRSDNLIANRHLYVTGTGVAGTTIYASNADLSITEGEYVDPYFSTLQVGVRRPSFDVCYTIACPLPIELVSFTGENIEKYNLINWTCATETNNNYFRLERSIDGINWEQISILNGAGNSNISTKYSYKDFSFKGESYNYYRLTQVDFNGQEETFNIIVVDNTKSMSKKIVKSLNLMGVEIQNPDDYHGVIIYEYSDGSHQKIYKVGN